MRRRNWKRVSKMPNGAILSRNQYQRVKATQRAREKGRVIPHASRPGYEKYDFTYSRGKNQRPASSRRDVYDFTQ